MGVRQSSILGPRLKSSVVPIMRTVPMLQNKINTRSMSSKADSDLVEFLSEEIASEKSNQKVPKTIPGFEISKNEAELTFTKKHGNEKIVVTLNVNHTVDSSEPDDGADEAPEMKSMPNFEVDIVKSDGKTLSFSLSYITPEDHEPGSGEDKFDDVFTIDEVTMFEGDDWTENKYAVAGDILDGHLYDLFMNMLDDRGINKEFADRLSDFCSSYEHGLYINLLQNLQKFAK